MHDRFRLNVGDTMRFDILGRIVTARVTSVRAVDWRDARSGGFMIVFRPGVLDDAPQSFIAPLRGPDGDEARARFQHDLVEQFPNVSVIDFHEILANVRDVMSRVTLAITVVGGLVLLSGALILIGAVAMTKFQRVYEAAVFKTLGATTRTIASMLLLEYGVLGLLAGTVGSLAAVGLTWGVSRYALDIPWRPFPAEHIVSVVRDGAPRRGDWRAVESRRAPAQAACDAPRGVDHAHCWRCYDYLLFASANPEQRQEWNVA